MGSGVCLGLGLGYVGLGASAVSAFVGPGAFKSAGEILSKTCSSCLGTERNRELSNEVTLEGPSEGSCQAYIVMTYLLS